MHDIRRNSRFPASRSSRTHAEIRECVACGELTVLVPPADSEELRRVPLDPEPDPSGAYVIRDGRAWPAGTFTEPTEPRYSAHFATCRFAERFHRR